MSVSEAVQDHAAFPNGSAGAGRELQDLLRALQAMRMGDFSVRMAGDAPGLLGKIADTFNDIVSTNQHFAQQL
jgi:methyl-accepting chemotaxis protein